MYRVNEQGDIVLGSGKVLSMSASMPDTRMYEEGNEFMIEKELHMNSFRHTHGLFQLGDFTLSSGKKSNFLIDCDKLTDDDLYTLAYKVAEVIPFKTVVPVPNGANRFAAQLAKFVSPYNQVLVVEDVVTTGKSLENVVSETRVMFPCIPIKAIALINRGCMSSCGAALKSILTLDALFI